MGWGCCLAPAADGLRALPEGGCLLWERPRARTELLGWVVEASRRASLPQGARGGWLAPAPDGLRCRKGDLLFVGAPPGANWAAGLGGRSIATGVAPTVGEGCCLAPAPDGLRCPARREAAFCGSAPGRELCCWAGWLKHRDGRRSHSGLGDAALLPHQLGCAALFHSEEAALPEGGSAFCGSAPGRELTSSIATGVAPAVGGGCCLAPAPEGLRCRKGDLLFVGAPPGAN